MDRLIVVSDLQIPYEDKATLNALDDFIAYFQPTTFVMNGDIIDFTGLSKFRLTLEQRASVDVELGALRSRLNWWRTLMPTADMVYIMGNHEARFADYITDHAPELGFLGDYELSFGQLARLDARGIKLVEPYGAAYDWHGVYITHGNTVRQHTAKANLDIEGGSGISGHTHRISSYYKTDRSGAHAWYESGCLCRLDSPFSPPPTFPGVLNWQQGFVYGYATGNRAWNIYQVAVNNHRFVAEGKQYGD